MVVAGKSSTLICASVWRKLLQKKNRGKKTRLRLPRNLLLYFWLVVIETKPPSISMPAPSNPASWLFYPEPFGAYPDLWILRVNYIHHIMAVLTYSAGNAFLQIVLQNILDHPVSIVSWFWWCKSPRHHLGSVRLLSKEYVVAMISSNNLPALNQVLRSLIARPGIYGGQR